MSSRRRLTREPAEEHPAPVGGGLVPDQVTGADFEALARERLSPDAFRYFAAGTGSERALRENVRAFSRWKLVPGAARASGEPSTETSVLGRPIAMPVLVAPVSFQHMAHPDGDRATAAAASAAGTIMCVSGTSVTTPLKLAAALPGGRRWSQIQCFRDESVTEWQIHEAVEAGVDALVFTADTPYPGRRDRALLRGAQLPSGIALPRWAENHDPETIDRASESVGPPATEAASWIEDLEAIRAISPLPVLVKGIMAAEDAVLACEHGVSGLIVSNHGGRHDDNAPATLDVLPRIVEAVGGRTEVLVDGGIRRGSDVVKALALGARAVLAGRAVIWGLACEGEVGALRVLEILRNEIRGALAEVGCAAPDALTEGHVAPSPPDNAAMALSRS
jgi:4-hydroxymandelate oxidase